MSPSRSRRDRRLSRPKRRRWPIVALVLILLLAAGAGAYWYLSETAEDGSVATEDPAGDGETPEDDETESPFVDALAATEEAGDGEVETLLKIRMPKTLDDGVPRRQISGEGVLATDLSEARIDYEMSKVPNSAGFFGHVDGDLATGYAEDDMLITFDLLDKNVLKDDGSWISYELPFLSTEYMFSIGIGQLRELFLSDPRVGLALLEGVEERGDVSGEAQINGVAVTEYEVEADAKAAAETVPELSPIFKEMHRNLELSSIPMVVSVDENDRIRRLDYEMVFPAKKGSGKVRLNIRHDLTEFGVEAGPELPPADEVVTYEDYYFKQ